MDIWILVIILLAIAIVLLVASNYGPDQEEEVEDLINEYSVQQSQELHNVKTRLAELEQQANSRYSQEGPDFDSPKTEVQADTEEAPRENEVVTAEARTQIIQLYSQGYTMHEISQTVNLSTSTIQSVVDDYIENR